MSGSPGEAGRGNRRGGTRETLESTGDTGGRARARGRAPRPAAATTAARPTPDTTATEPAETGEEPATTERGARPRPRKSLRRRRAPRPAARTASTWEETFGFTGGFDPTGEYLGEAFGIHSNLLVRTLVGYRHTAGAAGNELIPDLATDLGTISDDGLTYTFTLKDGIKFGPPLSREITSQDVAYAFERIGTESLVAQYGFYYTRDRGNVGVHGRRGRHDLRHRRPRTTRRSSSR